MNDKYPNLTRRLGRFPCVIVPVPAGFIPDPAGTVTVSDEAGNPLPASDSPVNVIYSNYAQTTASHAAALDIDPEALEAAFKAVRDIAERNLIMSCFKTPPDVEPMDWAALLSPDPEPFVWDNPEPPVWNSWRAGWRYCPDDRRVNPASYLVSSNY